MASNNSKYSNEFRVRTCKHIIESGKSATSVGEEMGIDKNTICRWMRDYRRENMLPSYNEEKGIKKSEGRKKKTDSAKHKADKKRIIELEKGISDLEQSVFEYIEVFYNRKRMHSSLKYMSPIEYYKEYIKSECV